jgi:hypothetical protein
VPRFQLSVSWQEIEPAKSVDEFLYSKGDDKEVGAAEETEEVGLTAREGHGKTRRGYKV